MTDQFQIATLTPGLLPPSVCIATHRAGELPLLDFETVRDEAGIEGAIQRLTRLMTAPFGIKLSGDVPERLDRILAGLPEQVKTVLLAGADPQELRAAVAALRAKQVTTLLEVTCVEQAEAGAAIGVDGLVAKGHEAGGRVGDETTFILLQRLQAETSLPVWAHGGIGMHTAAACAAAGAAGVILDCQLALTRESPLPEGAKSKIASMDGSETICLGSQLGETYRMYHRPGNPVVMELQELEARLAADQRDPGDIRAEWREAVAGRVGWDFKTNVLLLGQDAAFAAQLAERFRTVGGVLQAFRAAITTDCQVAERWRPLAEGSPLAVANGTRYPILQGPMTRVSDVPEFTGRVAEAGALPFLALALMRAPEIRKVLGEAQRRLGTLPWGVGILGFVPPELRQEQMEVISEFRPPFALIAGGRPDQARTLEQQGIATYLHVPSPGLLRMFVQQGARRFVFEGRECGGHVGPRTSFVLWNQMVEVLLSAPEFASNPAEFHVVFAAGIHDALSAAMVSVIAAPLAERGAKIGVLLGTAYLFTEDAVASGAILETFQEQARECRNTVLLETGAGHSTRCVNTPFAEAFASEKRRMAAAGRPAEEIRQTLEELNLGRLRIASKGVTRNPGFAQDPTAPRLMEVSKDEQVDQGMYMIGQVAALRHSICTVAALHHDVAVEGSNRLARLTGRSWQRTTEPSPELPCDVAIVGMSCLLPKAPDLLTYWENILSKVDAVTEVPRDRWDARLHFDADPKAKDKVYSKWGGFIDDTVFDPMQYGMPPASLRSIEPAQLLTLEVVRAALADAGYLERPFARERTSVILGAGGGAADLGLGYGVRSFIPELENLPEFQGRTPEILERLNGRLPEWTEDSFAGILTNVSAGRVANRFNFGGSNYTVDAACASSLAAVSLATKELENRTSDMVIVGGMDTLQNPFTYLCFSKTHALSPRGRCRTFDESADGIAISEGIAILVLKRLADAERDGDRIYAVIKGVGSSSDGKDRGLTAPRPEGQARALTRAYAKAGLSPATVGLVEAHGTGTVAGDGAEVQALTKIFSEAGTVQQSCAIGSVKSMIGHTKCTAGAAGLLKTALALHHHVLPPTIGVEKPNPRARFAESPFFVNTETRPWLENLNGLPRRAGVSAFGFGGTNFHVVLEEYTGDPFAVRRAPARQWPDELFVWKSHTREGLLTQVESWAKALSVDAAPSLRDLAYSAWTQAAQIPLPTSGTALQLAIVASSVDDLKQKLGWARESLVRDGSVQINDPRGIYFSARPLAAGGKIAFLFPGQGSQYPGMLQDLLLHFPEMRETFEAAVRVLDGKLDQPLSAYVFPPSSFNREEQRERQRALTQTNVAQPALGAVSLALFGLLKELGLEPDMAAGHSYGEYSALAAAGAFSFETLIALSEARGRFIVEGAGAEPGAMAAVEAEAAVVTEVLSDFEGLCLANANAPRQSVISGPLAAVEKAVARFTAQGVTVRIIPVACAFHSAMVAPAQPRLADFLAGSNVNAPGFTVYSNTTAAPYEHDAAVVRERLVEHLVRPVEFVAEIEAMYQAGARVFVEVGPRSVLTSLVDQILGERPKLAVASNQSGRPGLTQLLHLLGHLAAEGVALKLDRLYADRACRQVNLATLQSEYRAKPLPPSVWMVNGARAVPLKEANAAPLSQLKQTAHSAPRAFAAAIGAATGVAAAVTVTPAPSSMHTAVAASTPPSFSPPLPPSLARATVAALPEPASEARALSGAEDLPDVMGQFQQMMARFLDVQKSVMLAYLEGGGPAALPGPAVSATPRLELQPIETAVFARPPAPEPVAAVASVPVPAAIPAAAVEPSRSGPTKEELTTQLLSIVSDRTGYPPEMLDLNLDLEADLGIDSIKRVEILGTFQQTFAAAGIGLAEGLMERLSAIRTLQGIVDVVAQGSPASVEEAVVEPDTPAQEQIPPPVSGKPEIQQLTAQLLTIVSERTGYPPDMLDLNLDLEADLGIDSIKRVEILGTVQQTLSAAGVALPEGLMERLTGVRTLQGIIEQLSPQEGVVAPSAPAPSWAPTAGAGTAANPAIVATVVEEQNAIRRYTLTAVETPLCGVEAAITKERLILITDGGHPAVQEFVDGLVGRGYKVAVVRQESAVVQLDSRRYGADLGAEKSVEELISLVNTQQGPIGAIVHLLPLRGERDFTAHDDHSWKDQLRLGVTSLFHLARAAGKQLRELGPERKGCLIAATAMGGAFLAEVNADAKPAFPDHGAIAGLMKSLALEWPEVRVKAVDCDIDEDGYTLASHLLAELRSDGTEVEVGYAQGRRVTPKLVHAPVQHDKESFSLDADSVVLITGGARGITARAAVRLAELYRPTLVIAGRSPLPAPEELAATAGITAPKALKAALMEQMRLAGEILAPALVERAYARLLAEREIRGNLAALRKLGAPVHYYPVDVRDVNAFSAFIDTIYASFGRLDGVIHGAGVIEDRLVQDKTPDSFDRVFGTKVDSAFVLTRKVRPETLKFLMFFSSVSGRFGNRGQGDYAAANEVLNKLAVCLDRSWPGRVVAVNWGPWDTEGMVSAEVRKQFADRGVSLISPTIGLRRFEEELKYGTRGAAEVVIGGAVGLTGETPTAPHHALPLLRHAAPPRSNGHLEVVRELNPDYDLFLRDHLLDGQPVLPLAVATELMAEVVAHGWPDMQVVRIQELRALHGIVVDGSRTVRVTATTQSGGSPDVTRIGVEITGAAEPHRLHYRATIEVARTLPAAPTAEVAPLRDGQPFGMDLAELYRRWLFHGPLFQGIQRVKQVGPSGITSLLSTSLPERWIAGLAIGQQWLIDPLMFDSALQLLVLWAREHWDMTPLPSGFQRFRRFAGAAASRVICELRILPNTGGQTIYCDIFFLNAETGSIIAILENMQGTCSKALNRLAGGQVLEVAGRQS